MVCDWRSPGLLTGLLMTLCPSSQLAFAEDVESPKDDIAAQIRAQGYACDQPQSATRDTQTSRPDEEVWLLRCEGRAIAFVSYLTWRRGLNVLINKGAPAPCSALGESVGTGIGTEYRVLGVKIRGLHSTATENRRRFVAESDNE